MKGLNAGSGQRPFAFVDGWLNMDIQERWKPDFIGDWSNLSAHFMPNELDYVVAHHTIEHVGCGEPIRFIAESQLVLKPGGSLLIFVPDMRTLARRWLLGELDDYQYFVNVYGAFMGDDADRHRWGYSRNSLVELIQSSTETKWSQIKPFDWRYIPGADIARDWWILGIEAVK